MGEKPREPRFHGEVSEKSHTNMSKIHSKDTSIELRLRSALWNKGIRYRKNCKNLPGRPDIAKDWDILKPKLEKGKNSDYWIKKIQRNIERDDEKDKELLFQGWNVLHFWGKDIMKHTDECVKVIQETIFNLILETDDVR